MRRNFQTVSSLLRWRYGDPGTFPYPDRPGGAATAHDSHLHVSDSGPVHAPETAHPGGHRQAFLQEEVRREEDPGSLLGTATRRDRPRSVERRPCGCGEGNDAAGARFAVAASGSRSEGRLEVTEDCVTRA